MLRFQKYPSILPASDEAFLREVRTHVPADVLFAVQEKVHGANVCFLCDDLDIRMARRQALLQPGEPFFGYEDLLERYSGAVYMLFNLLRQDLPDLECINVYGELFGGGYPHPGVRKHAAAPVQKGVWYSPGYGFYGFDILAYTPGGRFYLPVERAASLFRESGFLYARTLYTGPLTDCLAFPTAFQTTLPEQMDLPPIRDNLCEGVVLKPLSPLFLPDGTRVVLKNKNPRFLRM